MTSTPSFATLAELEQRDEFVGRHIGPDEQSLPEMLKTVGVDSLDELIAQTVPAAIRSASPLDLPAPMTEHAALAKIKAIAAKNQIKKSLIGQGYYGTPST